MYQRGSELVLCDNTLCKLFVSHFTRRKMWPDLSQWVILSKRLRNSQPPFDHELAEALQQDLGTTTGSDIEKRPARPLAPASSHNGTHKYP